MFGKNRSKKLGLCLMVVTASLVLAAIWAVLAVPGTALDKPDKKGPKEPKHQNTPICVEFMAVVESEEARIRSDSGGIYCDGDGSGKTKTSTFLGRRDPGGEFVLKTNNTNDKGRSLVLDFFNFLVSEECTDPPDRLPFPRTIVNPVRVRMLTGRFGTNPDLRTMEDGATAWASMVIEFYLSEEETPDGDEDVQQWQLWFGEKFEWWSTTNSDCEPCLQAGPGVWVTCTGTTTEGSANEWTIEAFPNTVACLESFVDWSTNIQHRGNFYMPFKLTAMLK